MRSPQLYALYKQATQDPPIDKAANPGTFDFKVSLATPLYKIVSMGMQSAKLTFLRQPGQSQETCLAENRRRGRYTYGGGGEVRRVG
jgi:hypothetical protein